MTIIARTEWDEAAVAISGSWSTEAAKGMLDHLRLRHEAEIKRLENIVERYAHDLHAAGDDRGVALLHEALGKHMEDFC